MESTLVKSPPRAIEKHPCPRWAYEAMRAILHVYFGIGHRLRIVGREHVPAEGPAIIAPNHLSYYDPLLVGMAIPRRTRYMAWNALFRIRVLDLAMRKLGAFPVDPKHPDAGAYKFGLQTLRANECLVIFPEGRRGDGESLESFETGVARLALRSGAPIVPTTITGASEAWPRTRRWPRLFHRLGIEFHPPIRPPRSDLRGEALREAIEALNEAVRSPIAERYGAYRRGLRGR